MDKENVVFLCDEILISFKKEDSAICYSMEKTEGNYAKRNMPKKTYDLIYMQN